MTIRKYYGEAIINDDGTMYKVMEVIYSDHGRRFEYYYLRKLSNEQEYLPFGYDPVSNSLNKSIKRLIDTYIPQRSILTEQVSV